MKKTNLYDQTKSMLNTIRNLNESKQRKGNLLEQEEQQENNVFVINSVEVKINSTDSTDLQLGDEEKTKISNVIDLFRQQVSQVADLNPGFTITEDEYRLDGSIPDFEIIFTIIAGNSGGLYITSEMTEVTQEVLDMITKLSKFSNTYKTTFEPFIRNRKL